MNWTGQSGRMIFRPFWRPQMMGKAGGGEEEERSIADVAVLDNLLGL